MRKRIVGLTGLAFFAAAAVAMAATVFTVIPGLFDPGKTFLASAQWVKRIGCDIRKPDDPRTDVKGRGSHCGAGAPRFDITLTDGTSYFIGCNSPSADSVVSGQAWQRLRYGGTASTTLMAYSATTYALTDIKGRTVDDIQIVYDEGSDTGPDNFGMAILDNIDINGSLVGH